MNHIRIYVLLAAVALLHSTDCTTPVTLCVYRICTNTGMTCPSGAILQIRDGYRGEVTAERWRDFYQERCSSDGVFCVRLVPDSGKLFFRYASVLNEIPENARHTAINAWCRDKPGVEYWFNV